MNTKDILEVGHKKVLKSVEGLSKKAWITAGACGVWSVKDIMAHLASYEHSQIDGLQRVLGKPSPTLDAMDKGHQEFNDAVIAKAKKLSPDEVLADYTKTFTKLLKLLKELTPQKLAKKGTIPWYGKDYSLEDFFVYQGYGHKREHAAQIFMFRDRLSSKR